MTDKHPNPKLACPRCEEVISGTNARRVRYRDTDNDKEQWKLLERKYSCPKCRNWFWHEVAAKTVEATI
jgi:uncharacterized protein with PIN domain